MGGDVLVLVTESGEEAATLAADVAASPRGSEARVAWPPSGRHGADRAARRPRPRPRLAAAFAGRFRSLTLGAPSLEDVFVDRTGHRFEEAGADAGEAA